MGSSRWLSWEARWASLRQGRWGALGLCRRGVCSSSSALDFPTAQMVKRLPAMQETRVRSLVGEDPLEKAMATNSSTLAWKIPWTEGAW